MLAFINEISLEGQFSNSSDFESAIKRLIFILNDLINLKHSKLYSDTGRLKLSSAINQEFFDQSFSEIRDISLKRAFYNLYYNKHNVENWRLSMEVDENEDFLWIEGKSENVKDTSIAEITERKLNFEFQPYLLINFQGSKFSGYLTIHIIKHSSDETCEIHCCEDKVSLNNWLNTNYYEFVYNHNSTSAPNEKQTLLRDYNKFIELKTNNRPGGKSLYKDKRTGQIWYIDSNHKGESAHLEVFSATGKKHLGKSDLDGNILPGTAIKGRKINLK